MARKRIEEIVVDVVFEGAEELKKLSGGFRELAKAIEPSDRLIEQARQRVVEFASGLGNSEQALKGQVKALQALRSQATIGGGVYKQLSVDVNSLTSELKQLEKEFKAVGQAAQQTDKQIAAQFPARRPEAFRLQIAALRRELDKLSVSSREYGDQLTTITTRQLAFSRAQARQGVIAGAQSVGAPLIGAMTPQQQLPQTTAALRLRINELRQDLENTNYTLGEYRERLGQVRVLQQELDRVTGNANETRKSEIRDRIANLRAINAENAALRERAAVNRSVAKGRARQMGPIGPMQGPQAPSELFRSIGAIADQPVASATQLMGRSYAEVAQQIRNVAASSDGSIRSLQRQRDVWQQLRVTISPLSADYAQVAKEADRSMAAIDRQLNRVQQRRRRMGAMEATQAAGAVISGGIFGGPEGAIGGAVGTAVGGVPGAFAGAAIGAQVGMIRKSLGAMAEFSAEIDRQRIALRGVVGSQEEYSRSLQFIDATSRRAAIPHDQLTRQFTQLAASVIGAGGNVEVAERAFRGMAAGIRGTGGSLADMQGAMLATSQVFSKGKVSAEEIRQQIGERLPGAFTTFANAIGKTPQMLDKMLQKGEVTLNDFMLLIEELIKTYEPSMDKIAASSQAAGDRLATTFARIRDAVGRELQPVGARFQEAIIQILTKNEEAIVGFAKSLASAAKTIADNSKLIAESLKVLLGFGAIAAAIPIATSVAAAFAKVTAAISMMGGAASVAGLAFKGMSVAMLAVPGFGWVAAGVVALGLLGKAVYDNNEAFRDFVNNITNIFASDFKRAVEDMADAARASANRITKAYEEQVAKLQSIAQFISNIFKNAFQDTSDSAEKSAATSSNAFGDFFKNLSTQAAAGFDGLNSVITSWWSKLPAPIRRLFEGQVAAILTGGASYLGGAVTRAANAPSTGMFGRFDAWKAEALGAAGGGDKPSAFRFPGGDIDGAGAGAGAGAKPPADRTLELTEQLNLLIAVGEQEEKIRDLQFQGRTMLAILAEQDKARLQIEFDRVRELRNANYESERAVINEIALAKAAQLALETEQKLREEASKRFHEELRIQEAVRGAIEPFRQLAVQQELQTQYAKTYSRLLAEGMLPAEAERIANFDKMVAEQFKSLDLQIDIAKAALVQAELQGAYVVDLEKEVALLERKREAVAGAAAAGPGEGKSDADRIQDAVDASRAALNELVDPVNQIVGAATAIGDAFANSFKGLITGATSAREAMRNFFTSLADYFADMAAKMIAEALKMQAIQLLSSLLGSVAGAAGGAIQGAGSAAGASAFGGGGPSFNPRAFSMPNIMARAKGGPVTSGSPYMVGEKGPELFVPFQSGQIVPTEVIAAAAATRDALRMPAAQVPFQGGGSSLVVPFQAATPSSADSASVATNELIRFESTVINGMEFVTRSEAENIGRVAASRGAELAQKRLKNNPTARRAAGIS
jgi:tape measure domain-containing protein